MPAAQSPEIAAASPCTTARGPSGDASSDVGVTHLADRDILAALEARPGRTHARQRPGLETEHEARIFGNGLNFFHPENWYGLPRIIGGSLMFVGMRARAHRNTTRIVVRTNEVPLAHLPPAFEGFTRSSADRSGAICP